LYKYEENDQDSKVKTSQIFEETKKTIISLKIQLEEAKRTEEVVKSQLKEKEEICEKLEHEIVLLQKELEKSIPHFNRSLKFEKSVEILNYIIFSKGIHSLRPVLAMIRIIRLLKKIQTLRLPSHQIR
jgi:hypothetical protein